MCGPGVGPTETPVAAGNMEMDMPSTPNITPVIPLAAARPRSEPVNLTMQKIRALPPRASRYRVADSAVAGLVIRVYPSGAKSFYARGRVGKGRAAPLREVRIGEFGQVGLADARDRARALLVTMRAGDDPTAARPGDMPLGELIDAYGDRLEARGVVKRADVLWSLRAYLKRHLKLPAGDLARAQVVSAVNALELAGKPGAASYLRKNTTGLLNWGVDAGHLQASVMAGYRREKATRAERLARPRITFVDADQLAAFWRATEAASTPVFCDLLRLTLLTGQRRTETALMRWDDVVDGIWTIPAAIAKTGAEHRVPLGPTSWALIAAQPRHAGTDLVFAGRGLRPISGWSKLLAPVRDALGMPTFAPHALRRSYRTGLAELGIPEALAETMIAHKRSDLVGRYDKSERWAARVEAQARWEAHIAAVTA